MKKEEYLKLLDKTKQFMDSLGWGDLRGRIKARLRRRKTK